MSRRRKSRHEPHVRLYRHELECDAYRSLSTDARALLVEMRALYSGTENRVHMSVREAMRRLGVGQKRAQRARDELLDRGFIRLLETASFSRKVRHAPKYALTNEPLENRDGATAPKDYMRWPPEKSTVVKTNTDGMRTDYRAHAENVQIPPDGSQNEYRHESKTPSHGSQSEYVDSLPRSGGSTSATDLTTDLLLIGLLLDGAPQLRLCTAIAALAYGAGTARDAEVA